MPSRTPSLRRTPRAPLQLTIGVCTPIMEDNPSHWILMLAERGAEYATWYHVIGGPSLASPWKVDISEGRLNSWTVNNRYYVAEILAKHRRKVKASAKKVPGRFCQGWVVDVIGNLEKDLVVPVGTQNDIAKLMEADPYYGDAPPKVEKHQNLHEYFDAKKIFDWIEKHCFTKLLSPY
ncbi:hypothetical protein ACHAPJ_001778 [Fusarium lateritium]